MGQNLGFSSRFAKSLASEVDTAELAQAQRDLRAKPQRERAAQIERLKALAIQKAEGQRPRAEGEKR